MDNGINLAIVGATGAVGEEMIRCLDALDIPVGDLRLVASKRSEGKEIETPFGKVIVETVSEEVFKESDVALVSAGSSISKEIAPMCKENDCIMIDNSSAFRYEKGVPLVVPEINPEDAKNHNGIIANPNCTTTIAAVVLWPLHQAFALKKVIVSTYQSASGAGTRAMDELINQTKEFLSGEEETVEQFQHKIAFNLIPHIGPFQDNGYTKEEMKVEWETHKIFGDNSIDVSCTAVRIPVLRAHSEAVTIETEESVTPEKAMEILESAPGVKVVDDPAENVYPMPRNASGKFDVEVGRIRQSLIFGENGLDLFIAGDQLLKGAALNAVQILQTLIHQQ